MDLKKLNNNFIEFKLQKDKQAAVDNSNMNFEKLKAFQSSFELLKIRSDQETALLKNSITELNAQITRVLIFPFERAPFFSNYRYHSDI